MISSSNIQVVSLFFLLPLAGCASPLIRAAEQGHADEVIALLGNGKNVDSADSDGSALSHAADNGHADIVKVLLAKGADVDARNARGSTALHYAAFKGHAEIVKLLISHGASADASNIVGATPLMNAAENGYGGIAAVLLDAGANVNARIADNEFAQDAGFTALMLAARSGRADIVKTLLARGAEVGVTSTQGQTALSLAQANGQSAILRLLKKAAGEDNTQAADSASSAAQPAPAVQLDEEKMKRMLEEAVKNANQAKPAEPAPRPEFSSDVDKPGFEKPQNPDNFAVVVGIERYAGLPEAQFAQRDAEAVREHLLALGYPRRNVAFLTGQQATKTGLVKNLESWLPRNVNRKSTVFFYFSGHGAPNATTGQAYLVPVDGDPEYLEDTAYPVKQLYQKLNALNVKQVIVALDSCFSGRGERSVLAKGTRPLVNKVDIGLVAPGKIIAFSASEGNQISGTLEEQGHGLFTYYFLKGLDGAAKDGSGNVTVQSLYDYMVPHVQDEAKRHNRDQTPQLMPAAMGDKSELRLR